MQVTVQYVNPPKDGRKNGSLRLTNGSFISVSPELLPLFEGCENSTIDIETREWTPPGGKPMTFANSGPNGTRAAAPRAAAQSRPAPPPLQTAAPRNVDTDKHIFVTGIVGRAMGSGKFAASEVRVLTQAALEAFEMLSKPPLPKPVPIETWTDNRKTDPPPPEEGDPGAQLQ
jgi:hypothetical protein